MTQAELYKELNSLGLPLAYHHFSTPQTPPYIVYLFSYSSDLIADNQNYKSISNFQVELYTTKKDLASEKLIEDKFKSLSIPYLKTELYLETENLFEVLYEIKLI